MHVRESVGIAIGALRANKLRSFLTLLGVIIGVSSVIAVMSLVQGLDEYVTKQLTSAGSDVFTVDKVGVEFDFTKVTDKLRRRDLTTADAHAIARAGPHVEAAVAERADQATVQRGRHVLQRVEIRGVEQGYMDVNDLPVDHGRALGDVDVRTSALTCVIGSDVAENLFGALDPLGRNVRVAGVTFAVVGVGARKGSSFGQSQDMYVLVPLSAFERLYGRVGSVAISVRASGQDGFAQAQDEARSVLRMRRHVAPAAPDDFEIVTPEMYTSLWRNLSGAIFIVILGVSVISLVVGGIVIMNIMLVSVTERTREIGIRKALGARRRDILGQFLVEAITLASAGGAIGLLLGVAAAFLIGLATPLPIFVSPTAIALGLTMSLVVGVAFGAWPAARAARKDPIEALRYE